MWFNDYNIYDLYVLFFCFCKIDGKIEVLKLVKDWGSNKLENWLFFDKVLGFIIIGFGFFDFYGESWWFIVKFDFWL